MLVWVHGRLVFGSLPPKEVYALVLQIGCLSFLLGMTPFLAFIKKKGFVCYCALWVGFSQKKALLGEYGVLWLLMALIDFFDWCAQFVSLFCALYQLLV